jgi:acid phosphatase
MKIIIFCVMFCLLVTSCIPVSPAPGTASPASPGAANIPVKATVQVPTATQTLAATLDAPGEQVPVFDHIVIISLENHSYQKVIGNPKAPYLNELADKNVLFTNYFAVTHPSEGECL